MSPALASLISSRLLACISSIRPTRSVLPCTHTHTHTHTQKKSTNLGEGGRRQIREERWRQLLLRYVPMRHSRERGARGETKQQYIQSNAAHGHRSSNQKPVQIKWKNQKHAKTGRIHSTHTCTRKQPARGNDIIQKVGRTSIHTAVPLTSSTTHAEILPKNKRIALREY